MDVFTLPHQFVYGWQRILTEYRWQLVVHYRGRDDFKHDELPATGVLLVNLGTPEKPTAAAVRRYLAEFLSDPRVVEMNRWLWKLILHGIILRFRPKRAARAYRSIWTDSGSPLMVIGQRQLGALQKVLQTQSPAPIRVALGMSYGQPSIESALNELYRANVQRLLILPLYPQYSGSTTGSVFDAVTRVLQGWRNVPELRVITRYHDFPTYIDAVSNSIARHWEEHGEPERLLLSFHGLPKRYLLNGDPYFCECHKTARLVAEKLGLDEQRWQVAFQSRFGREEWLKPYTDHTLRDWARQGIKRVDVICPGFSADCLETLEEINMQNREIFLGHGGEQFHYIPALNDHPSHIEMLSALIHRHATGWPEFETDWDAVNEVKKAALRLERAKQLGAAQ